MKVTAIFDIGKTNKKFFLFDKNFREVYKEIRQFEEIQDEDGFPCDDLPAIEKWMKTTLKKQIKKGKFDIAGINFSTYGASFVHIDRKGKVLSPLYNYLKPYPEELLNGFYEKYGDAMTFARQTASPPLGMLNSGLQLYWIKHRKSKLFNKIHWSLHLPQYLSFVLTGIPLSDYTSIGCHTSLWSFEKQDYHPWVYAEGIDRILPPVVDAAISINKNFLGKKRKVGVGIHDSSAALIPYLLADKNPFLLISTGTWSIVLNPFSKETLSDETVRASRLFLGNEYDMQVKKLCEYFGKSPEYHKNIRLDQYILSKLKTDYYKKFKLESIDLASQQQEETAFNHFVSFEEAYHQLLLELAELQIHSVKRALGKTRISKIYIDEGFAENEIFTTLLSDHFKNYKLRSTKSPLGSALGAAMIITKEPVDKRFLKKQYGLRKFRPLFLKR